MAPAARRHAVGGHFGYHDRLSQPVIEGSGEEPTPGSGAPLKPGEFILGYPDEEGPPVQQPQPAALSRNGSFMAYRRLEEHVGGFRAFLKEHGKTPEGEELIAAKLMGRCRSGAPLVLAPDADDPELGAPAGHGSQHASPAHDPAGRHLRPHLPEGMPEDGRERGIAAFIICASLVRQFEFAQNVWANDVNFHELVNERDPIMGHHDGTLEFKIPTRPIRRTLKGLPAFTTVKGGAYFFLPGLDALRRLATPGAFD